MDHVNHQIGFIGLGKMGTNIVEHLVEQDVAVVAYNRTRSVTEEFTQSIKSDKLTPVYDLKELVNKLQTPRVIWMMVPNGAPVDEVLDQLIAAGLQKGDIVIDGGNTYYKDTVRRGKKLADMGVAYVDCGTSGGLAGARNGACLMIGGEQAVVDGLRWVWDAVAVKDGWGHFGPTGAGHFVKMVHNGVEYGIDQAFGEGFEILSKGPYTLDFAKVAHVWSHGSVVRGWLVELLAQAFDADPKLTAYTGKVGGGQTGGWTTEAAREEGVAAAVIETSLTAREQTQTKPTFAGKVVSALRAGYGGHKEPK